MSAAERHHPVTLTETKTLFAGLTGHSSLILAVSGGPDSTALLHLAARWRAGQKSGPKLFAVTVDHGLRKESASEARAVARLCRKLAVPHRTLRWAGTKPKTGLQEAARRARYDLLAREAARIGAHHVLTAHTLDDQAETILFRLSRGSGLSGLTAMSRESERGGVTIVRPLLDIPKARLVATLQKSRIPFADDPSNRDPRFARPRLREIMPLLEKEGLSAQRLALLARRVRRAEAALAAAVTKAAKEVSRGPRGALWAEGTRIAFDAAAFFRLPEEVALRLLGRAAAHAGNEGPVELGKLEALQAALRARKGDSPLRRTLAGAMISCEGGLIVVERAPPRRIARGKASDRASRRRISALTKSEHGAGRTDEGRVK